jgi:hypothetical protein
MRIASPHLSRSPRPAKRRCRQSSGTARAGVSRGNEATPPPERRGFGIDGVDHESTTSDERRRHDALEGVFQQPGSDPAPGPGNVRRELAEQQARHRIGRLAGADGSRQDVRNDRCGRKAVIADDTARLMHDQDSGETLLLVGKRSGLEPMVEGRLSAGELGNVVGCGLAVREPRGPRLSFP